MSKTYTKIFASSSRQEILDVFGIKYAVDTEFNFVFDSEADKRMAINALDNACEL